MVTKQHLFLQESYAHSREREEQGAKIFAKQCVSFCQESKMFLEFLPKEVFLMFPWPASIFHMDICSWNVLL